MSTKEHRGKLTLSIAQAPAQVMETSTFKERKTWL